MNWIYYIYIVVLAYLVWKSSKKGTLYYFSPLLLIYVGFPIASIYPLVTYDEGKVPSCIQNVTMLTCIMNLFFMLKYRKQFFCKVDIVPEYNLVKYAGVRKTVLWIFIAIMFLSGLYTGVTQMMIAGVNVEDYRRTSEVGIGFIRDVPGFGMTYLTLEYFLLHKKMSFIKAGIIGVAIGMVVFMATAARGGFLTYAICFFIWANMKYRGFRWYEYFLIFHFLRPVIAAIMMAIRSASVAELANMQLFDYEKMIFGANTIRLGNYIERTHNFLMGESYYYPIVKLIPRFIWPDKPVAIDYKYKEMVGLEFDGGGIFTSSDFDMYLNFGYWYVVGYCIMLWLIHWMYKKLILTKTSFADKMLYVTLLGSGTALGAMISHIQVYFLFLLIFYFINKKWRVI